MEKRILLVNDFSATSSGYAIYGRNLLERFHRDGYKVAELATFCSDSDVRKKNIPWKVYGNLPKDQQEEREYSSNFQNSNGKWKFEAVCLDFKPHYVLDIRDVYMYEFESYSPFRQFYNWIVMGTIDGVPQHPQWLDIYNSADGLISYTQWGKEVLEETGLKVNGVASPSASEKYFPIPVDSIEKFKGFVGIKGKIVGSVMRNQPRKLFNELFEGFAKYQQIAEEKTFLYCHTTYPDLGWDIGDLLIKHNLLSSVLFTYKCFKCGKIFPTFFRDMKTHCPFCKYDAAKMPEGQNAVDEPTMNKIYNMFDCYVQLASREGFGMPQAEAAACDVPVITVPYAGMSDMETSLGAIPCAIKGFWLSYPMNMMEALPDTSDLANAIHHVLTNVPKNREFRKAFESSYNSWENTYQVWKKVVDDLPVKNWEKRPLNNPPVFNQLPQLSNYEYADWLVKHVYGVDSVYLKSRIANDLNTGITFPGFGGGYMTENNSMGHHLPFNRQEAYKHMLHQRLFNNFWLNQL